MQPSHTHGMRAQTHTHTHTHLHRALVQDLAQLKGSTTMLSEPVIVERPSGLNPQLFHLQKDYMSARLETKEEQIRQLEQQCRAVQQMLVDKTKVRRQQGANKHVSLYQLGKQGNKLFLLCVCVCSNMCISLSLSCLLTLSF